jgi:hypothetical protein
MCKRIYGIVIVSKHLKKQKHGVLGWRYTELIPIVIRIMDYQASHEQNTQGIPDIPSVWTQNDTSDVDTPGNFCKSLFYNVKLSIKLSDLVYVLKLCFN